jgi:hypothetical protein
VVKALTTTNVIRAEARSVITVNGPTPTPAQTTPPSGYVTVFFCVENGNWYKTHEKCTSFCPSKDDCVGSSMSTTAAEWRYDSTGKGCVHIIPNSPADNILSCLEKTP